MNWIYSSAARAGLGPPEWIVILILLALVFVATLETGNSEAEYRGPLLTRRDKYALLTIAAVAAVLLSLLAWRKFAG